MQRPGPELYAFPPHISLDNPVMRALRVLGDRAVADVVSSSMEVSSLIQLSAAAEREV